MKLILEKFNVKVKYSIEMRTNLETDVLRKNILQELRQLDYNIIAESDSLIEFDNDNGRLLSSRLKDFTRLPDSRIDIVNINGTRFVNISYTISITGDIIVIAFTLLVASIFTYFYFIGTVLFLLQLLVKAIMVNGLGIELLTLALRVPTPVQASPPE
ncbi:hypothetical protein [uncultured Mucilaginibacter sp.]|uniref:hypothetical protein n=1 Tax=uncultured Mucilaginibacter sp. TaxID=797541 RepID=UPI0025FCD301|nr:hypothetical protein [uncultured Mucilaginibacter sp.]